MYYYIFFAGNGKATVMETVGKTETEKKRKRAGK